jgi:hypothetical protein
MGVQPTTPAQYVVEQRNPTIHDITFNLGTRWLNELLRTEWLLVNLAAGIADWIMTTDSTGGVLTLTAENTVVVPPTAGNIDIYGGTGITTVGNAGDSTVTINASAEIPITFKSGNDLSTATAAANVITFLGTGDTIITASGSTVSINSTGGGGGSGTSDSTIGAVFIVGTTATAGTYWGPPFDTTGLANTVQIQAEYVVPTSGTISNLYADAGINTQPGTVSVTVNKNGTNTALTTTVTAATPGVYTDLTHSFSVVAGDTIQFEVGVSADSAGGAIRGTVSILFAAAGGGASAHPLITTYSTPGTFTWEKATGTTFMSIYGCSGGAGGGSGAQYASQKSSGGSGGGGGPSFYSTFPASFVGSSELVVIGAGGSGGTSVTSNNTDGNDGTLGGESSFGVIFSSATTPTPGQGGTTGVVIVSGGNSSGNSSPGGTSTIQTVPPAGAYGNLAGNGGSLQSFTPPGATGGGGGIGASSTSPIPVAAGNGGNITANGSPAGYLYLAGGTGGIESGTINGGVGANSPVGMTSGGLFTFGTGGGGGGGQSTGSVAGIGGNGGFPGGGGGGGGGSINGTASGAGGNGAGGIVYVVEW